MSQVEELVTESRLFDGNCPYCGRRNKDLLLEETDGWMECERCRRDVHLCSRADLPKVPLLLDAADDWVNRRVS